MLIIEYFAPKYFDHTQGFVWKGKGNYFKCFRKNEIDKTLSKKGKLLVKILDFFDENHCEKSIKEF